MEYKERHELVFYAGLRVNRMQCVLSKARVIDSLFDDKCVKLARRTVGIILIVTFL